MVKHLKDFGAHGQSMETRVCAEIESLRSFLESHAGLPLKVSHLFYSNVTNSLMDILLSKKFEPGDPEAAELAELIFRQVLKE